MALAWAEAFGDTADVEIVEGDILNGSPGAVVSPANSFGYMDGGIDLAYRQFFGMEIQHRVQAKIRTDHYGELPVGQAMVVPTGNSRLPFLIVAPTMRVPDRIADTVNVYLAFRAALLALVRHNASEEWNIDRMHCPALGAGVGAMPIGRVARQMHAALRSVFGPAEWRDNPAQILLHHEDLRS